jgi:hypothetical protein
MSIMNAEATAENRPAYMRTEIDPGKSETKKKHAELETYKDQCSVQVLLVFFDEILVKFIRLFLVKCVEFGPGIRIFLSLYRRKEGCQSICESAFKTTAWTHD